MNSTISFEIDGENSLTVQIDTTRLHLNSLNWDYYPNYAKLLTNADNMRTYKYGRCWNEDEIQKHFTSWVECWKKNDPFSSLAVFEKETDNFIGHVALKKDKQPGQAEIGYAFDNKTWGRGYGKEAVTNVVCNYLPKLAEQKYLINDEPFSTLIATTRLDNPASFKILESLGMTPTYQQVKFGNLRQFFSMNILPCTLQTNMAEMAEAEMKIKRDLLA